MDEETFFLVQGWMPVSEQKRVEAFTTANGVAAIMEDPTEDDEPPTLVEKPGSTGGGADAMGFFQTPNYRAWDPGNVVFYSFSVFFAMIMSDAMYSLIFGLIIFFCRKGLNKTEAGRRLKNLGYFMAGAGVVWGVIIGSYFGTAPSGNSVCKASHLPEPERLWRHDETVRGCRCDPSGDCQRHESRC